MIIEIAYSRDGLITYKPKDRKTYFPAFSSVIVDGDAAYGIDGSNRVKLGPIYPDCELLRHDRREVVFYCQNQSFKKWQWPSKTYQTDIVNDAEVIAGKKCPYCGSRPKLVESSVIYGPGHDYGMMWHCQPCDAYVGTHKEDNKTALGRLANWELRQWKKNAHAAFDPIWKFHTDKGVKKHVARTSAYYWLAEKMGIPRDLTHIGMFDVEQCKQVVKQCTGFNPVYLEIRSS